jgi:pimeloyl-ACP methyl ester carboxylesterase
MEKPLLKHGSHDTGEVTQNYIEVGEGDPLVLLHGFTSDWRAWSQEIGLLSHRWRVLVPDARGHGGSSGSEDGDYGYGARTRDAASFIKGVVGGPAVVVGHSMGGATAMGVASLHPELVRAAVLEDPHVSGNREMPEEARVWMEGSRGLLRTSPSFQETVQYMNSSNPRNKDAPAIRLDASQAIDMGPETWTPFIDGTMFDDFDPDTVLSKIECPVLLVQADADQGGVVTDEVAERLRAGISDCTHIKLDVGHSIHKDAPIEFRRSLFDFLDTI